MSFVTRITTSLQLNTTLSKSKSAIVSLLLKCAYSELLPLLIRASDSDGTGGGFDEAFTFFLLIKVKSSAARKIIMRKF